MSKSILTFNYSVSDKKELAAATQPLQIMPATINYIKDADIDKYTDINNPNILIHLNYITRMFSSHGLEKDSSVRYSLRQYGKLATKIGTKNILIHMPKTLQEWNNFVLGYKIIHDELISKGFKIHFEITAWSKDLHAYFTKDKDRQLVISEYYERLLEVANTYNDTVYIVIDTAHMFANGCSEDDIIATLQKYSNRIEYLHWNGNIRPMFSTDSHVPIFSSSSLMTFDKISQYVASLGKICVCEITKDGEKYQKWVEYANKYGFDIVKENKMAVC